MNHDQLQYAGLLELLIDGPVGGYRRWAAFLVLRMLETRAVCPYREESRLGGLEHAQSAIASLRAAARVLSESEQGLLLRTVLLASWEGLRRGTGLSLRVPEILDDLVSVLGVSPCLAAARSVIEQASDAVRRYPLDGLLPEVRRPGEGMIVTFDARESRTLGGSVGPIEIDGLTIAVRSFHASGWEANLRPMVAWWLETQEQKEADRVARRLLTDLRRAAQDEQARWRALGLTGVCGSGRRSCSVVAGVKDGPAARVRCSDDTRRELRGCHEIGGLSATARTRMLIPDESDASHFGCSETNRHPGGTEGGAGGPA